jgi:2-polyprenyl-6-methoxyphenol hydroxylase-like FAD-dependent oxidoreductase
MLAEVRNTRIDVKNVNTWKMEAVVAESYVNKAAGGEDLPYAFLVGDAAHAFPPSGGFGMNTGIGDSFNLAHKIAKGGREIREYDRERRYIGRVTKELALKNYEKSLTVAKMLGLNKNNAELLTKAVDTFLPSFFPIDFKKNVLKTGLNFGLMMADTGI